MDLDRFRRSPLLGIVRGVAFDAVAPLVEAAVAGGLESLEITMNTTDAARLIERACRTADGRLAIGAGTVLDLADLESALSAGASFVVSPTLVRPVVEACVARGIPVFPGALTPQEIQTAWQAGASMVKVFPAKAFGPGYFREIKGPFERIPLLACGGISPENLGGLCALRRRRFRVRVERLRSRADRRQRLRVGRSRSPRPGTSTPRKLPRSSGERAG